MIIKTVGDQFSIGQLLQLKQTPDTYKNTHFILGAQSIWVLLTVANAHAKSVRV